MGETILVNFFVKCIQRCDVISPHDVNVAGVVAAESAVEEMEDDIEKNEDKKKKMRARNRPKWECLPDLVMENIFSRLTIRERYYSSIVCRNWNRIFYSPSIWSTFVMAERTMTRRRYNYYMGYQHTLDHNRAQICLNCVGRYFRKIIIEPISNFFNLYEFMNMLSYFAEFFDTNPLRYVHTLRFTFACHLIENRMGSELVFGTGGRLLQALKRLVSNLPGLRHLSLDDLLLERYEAIYLLDDVALNCCQSLRTLRLVNCSKGLCPILHVGVLLGLSDLHISPQQLGDEVVQLLGYTSLRNVHIVQTVYTEDASTVSSFVWKELRLRSPRLRVHLRVEGNVKQSILWQDKAPVRSVTYDSTHIKVMPDAVMTIVDMYANDLEIFAHLGLPRFYMACPFHERADSSLLYLCRQCPNLDTLVIRERISTATVLLLAYTGKNLRRLVVRRNAVIKRIDWPKSPDWSDAFHSWLSNAARSYEAVEREVSQILGYSWYFLSDCQFKAYEIDYSLE